jgi:UDP-N-acetyl-D-mannosaminuronic acid dehydrogenase
MLSSLETTNPIHYTNSVSEAASEADIHIVSVGSPVGPDGTPDLNDIKAVAEAIARRLKYGDLVVFRSTVPVGTMRRVVLPILERAGLTCGEDFHLAFAPERAVEGNALEELRKLPQVIGGFNRTGANVAARLFGHVTPTVIEVETLEEAELVKLINNTFRDLVFSFANEVAFMCDGYNINAFNVIRAANEGYPRDRIPMPSPGVGGTCLSKDPYLYTNPLATNSHRPTLGLASRGINRKGADYVLGKLKTFAESVGRRVEDMNVMIVGLAFKGMPETSDIRASTALEVLERLPDRSKVRVKDFVVPADAIIKLGCVPVAEELATALKGMDAVLVMNNHYRNSRFNVVQALRRCDGPMLFFDGWNMFDQREIESLGHVTYATMGYMTPGSGNRA